MVWQAGGRVDAGGMAGLPETQLPCGGVFEGTLAAVDPSGAGLGEAMQRMGISVCGRIREGRAILAGVCKPFGAVL